MNILVSNDDGFDSKGIQELAKAAARLGEVTVVAPHRERSTAGHSLTLHKPLRIHHIDKNIDATTGTPADCIYLGIRQVLKKKPDVILSGINRGANLGTDVHYSGTVAAAREGALLKIPSFAFSLVDFRQISPNSPEEPFRFEEAAEWAIKVVERGLKHKFPEHTFLNVNIPNVASNKIAGVRVARQGFRYYSNEVTSRVDPRGRDYFWIGGAYLGFEPGADCDCGAVSEHFVSVSPITIDCTDDTFYNALKREF